MRVIKAFYPMLKKSEDIALIINVSSEAGSITKCYRKNMIDYGMAKAAPLSSYEAAGILQALFDRKWNDFDGPRFITNDGNSYPF